MNAADILRRTLALRPSNNPFTLVDIGSMGGMEKEWLPVRSQIRAVGFEPDPREFAHLKNTPNEVYFNCALHKADGIPLTIHLSEEPGKSSIFLPNMDRLEHFPQADRFKTVGTVDLSGDRVRSLDSLVRTERLGNIHFIKLDTQGSELFILEGARETLRNSVVGVKVEVEFQELYKGQPLFSDVDPFLRGLGFDLIDIRRVFWRKKAHKTFSGKGQLVFGDALYLKSPAAMVTEGSSAQDRLAAALSFTTVGMVYGAHDVACDVLLNAANRDKENQEVLKDLAGQIQRRDHVCRIPRFWGTGKVFRLLDRLGRSIGHQRHEFAESDLDLGNRRIG